MCEYTQVEFKCGHYRFTVRAWCEIYERTHRRCKPNVVAIEFRLDERCGDCRQSSNNVNWMLARSSSSIRA